MKRLTIIIASPMEKPGRMLCQFALYGVDPGLGALLVLVGGAAADADPTDLHLVCGHDGKAPGKRDDAGKIGYAGHHAGLPSLPKAISLNCRERGCIAAVRINHLEDCGKVDLAAAMKTRPDVIVYPMAEQVAQIHALEAAINDWDVRTIASASQRIRCALLGSEDLANDLNAERGPDAIELD